MSSIESKLEQIEQAIQKQIAEHKEMGKVTRTFAIIGGVCLAGVVLVKAPIFILGAGAAFAGAAVTEMIRGRKSEQLNSMYETQAALMIEADGFAASAGIMNCSRNWRARIAVRRPKSVR